MLRSAGRSAFVAALLFGSAVTLAACSTVDRQQSADVEVIGTLADLSRHPSLYVKDVGVGTEDRGALLDLNERIRGALTASGVALSEDAQVALSGQFVDRNVDEAQPRLVLRVALSNAQTENLLALADVSVERVEAVGDSDVDALVAGVTRFVQATRLGAAAP